MKKIIALAMFASLSSAASASTLADKFADALSVIKNTSESISKQKLNDVSEDGGQSIQNFYNSGEAAQSIQQFTPPTEAQTLLLQTAQTLRALAQKLIDGTKNPSETKRLEACSVTSVGIEQRKWAPYKQGYAELHFEYKDIFNQFQTIKAILECK